MQHKRDWSSYNTAQCEEKTLALRMLNQAVDSLGIPYSYSGRGRPPLGLDDIIKSMVIKVFNNYSSRRSITDIRFARGMGYIRDVPAFGILCRYMRSPVVTSYLHDLYGKLAEPFIEIESVFALDSTGFSISKKH